MAEIQNNFIKSKMNKDLDDRLVPSGEYRDALNIAISRSEGDDVGALETILGNELSFDEENQYTCIGLFSDNNNNKIYYFVTNYIDSSSSGISNFAPLGAHCSIRVYDTKLNQRTILVQGSFLNFSSRSQITGVNIVENLLFWTDNRNQPRKINIDNAVAFPAAPPQSGRSTSVNVPQPYYTKEDQISVAKYYPYTPISLMDIYNTDLGNTPNASTMTNPSQLRLPDNSVNPDYEATFPGDPDYLSDKFIRLSYRFKFDDNEYSLIAPFTQPCFVPKQNGYFLDGDNEKAYRSTIVDFFENNVTQIIASIQFETRTPSKDLKIKELDILYKESDALIVKVIETISIKDVETVINENYARTGNGYWYNYKYISTKPYKTLTEDQITRVFDKVPVRALAQEVSGNRVIYGNFITTPSPPSEIDYYVTYGDKSLLISSSQIEYPNHTLKQNRNYQVGFVLADRYGRQSSVVLSSNDTFAENGGTFYGGSTIYVPYSSETFSTINWPGYALKTLVNAPIPSLSQSSTPGYPGLYKDETYGVDSTLITDGGSSYTPGSGTIYTTTSVTGTGSGLTVSVSVGGGGGVVIGATVVNPGAGYADGDIVTIDDLGNVNLATIKVTVLPPNPTGWHSYKIVIKQTQQDYYNVYLPGILRGYPQSYIDSSGNSNSTVLANEGFEVDETANIVLISDNINKIPKDLSEVGPVQKQYRSSIELFGRVKPLNDSSQNRNFNLQNYPGSVGDTVVSISTLSEANYNGTTLGNIVSLQENRTNPNSVPQDANYAYTTVAEYSLEYKEFYQSNTDPYIARISTVDPIGKVWNGAYKNQLAVYETNPVESLLDIYWETTSSGLISDLNQAVFLGGDEGAVQDGPNTFVLSESDLPGAQCFSGRVSVVNSQSNIMFDNMTFALIGITDDTGVSRDGDFVFEQQLGGTPGNPDGFQFFSAASTYFYYGSNEEERTFNFYINCTYTNPSTLIESSRVISLLNRKLANRSPRFVVLPPTTPPRISLQNCGSGVGPGGLVPVQSLVDEDVLVYTWMAVNGSTYEGGRDLEEIQFAQDPALLIDTDYFYTKWGNNLPGRPGVIEVWLRANAGSEEGPYQPIVRIIARDAGGATATCQFTAQVTPPIGIGFNFEPYNRICALLPDGWDPAPGGGGIIRFPMLVSNLDTLGSYSYSVTFSAGSSTGDNETVYANGPIGCGWPDGSFVGNELRGQINPPATASEEYWIQVTYDGVTTFDSINVKVLIEDDNNILAPYVGPINGWTLSAAGIGIPDNCPIDNQGCPPPP